MILKNIEIIAFKKVKNISLELNNVNILVGSNGSGKSSVLQAIHLACCLIRQADRIREETPSTVGIEELDYLPTNYYPSLGHNEEWGNKSGSPSSIIKLGFSKDDLAITAKCEMRSARNAGISVTGDIPSELTNLLRKKKIFYSAYIPGISGISNREEKKSEKVVLKTCSYGDSNIILRNALLLLQSKYPEAIGTLEHWMSEISGPTKIQVNHKEDQDLYISIIVTIGGVSRNIELIGSGHIQLLQIFTYLLLFKPGVLCIDEPDIHLHPSVQESLVKLLDKIASERNTKIIMTTHSPFILRGAPISAKIFWLSDGTLQTESRQTIELALGWGAFGKKIIIISEDSNVNYLKKLINQWPEISKFIAYYPGTGYKGLTSPKQAKQIQEALGNKFKILIHRDRDSLADDEVTTISGSYQSEGIEIWFTEQSDLEAYFCNSLFLSNLTGRTAEEIDLIINKILENEEEIKQMFAKQRKIHNEELHASGGSPTNEHVWASFQERPLRGAKGKWVFNQLKNKLTPKIFNEEIAQSSIFTIESAPSLKSILERILG